MCHVNGRREVPTDIWWGNLSDSGHSENPGVGGSIILKMIVKQ